MRYCSTLFEHAQLIRGGVDSIINLIFRLFFSKRKPAITLEDPNIKYALRLLDKQVSVRAQLQSTANGLRARDRSLALHPPRQVFLVGKVVSPLTFSDCQS